MARFARTQLKKCPFCKVKNPLNQRFCLNCGLDFFQMGTLSNAAAKQRMKEKERFESLEGEVIYVSDFPEDLSRGRTFIWLLFFGLFGAHDFYVGRYIWARSKMILFSLYIACVVIYAILESNGVVWRQTFMYASTFFAAMPLITFFRDLFAMIFRKYTVPVKLHTPVDLVEVEGGNI